MAAWGVLVSAQKYKRCSFKSSSCLSVLTPCTDVHVCPGLQAYVFLWELADPSCLVTQVRICTDVVPVLHHVAG